jgi:hypothetical protein
MRRSWHALALEEAKAAQASGPRPAGPVAGQNLLLSA